MCCRNYANVIRRITAPVLRPVVMRYDSFVGVLVPSLVVIALPTIVKVKGNIVSVVVTCSRIQNINFFVNVVLTFECLSDVLS